MASDTANALIREYVREYMEKVFYFCLRKCGSAAEAEDVAGDVGIDVVTALSKGTIPRNFQAWVWRIARNRYSRWVLSARKARACVSDDGIEALELAADGNIDDTLLRAEQLELLRRELAFVAADYREILIAYYIDDRRTEDIAKLLNLPKGTVVSKLFRIRQKLKEGMEMSREFGTKSYKPENVSFAAAGSQPSGLPWTAVSRKNPKKSFT
jgi:RNA polymerase sigma factor (sigma-70 family)